MAVTDYPLLDFNTYLADLDLSPFSRKVYVSNVRRILRATGGTIDDVEQVRGIMQEATPDTQALMVTSWRHFIHYAAGQGAVIEDPIVQEPRATMTSQGFPPEVAAALACILDAEQESVGFTPARVETLTWGHFEFHEHGVTLRNYRDLSKPWLWENSARVWFDTIFTWAWADGCPVSSDKLPFVPASPGSVYAMEARKVRKHTGWVRGRPEYRDLQAALKEAMDAALAAQGRTPQRITRQNGITVVEPGEAPRRPSVAMRPAHATPPAIIPRPAPSGVVHPEITGFEQHSKEEEALRGSREWLEEND